MSMLSMLYVCMYIFVVNVVVALQQVDACKRANAGSRWLKMGQQGFKNGD